MSVVDMLLGTVLVGLSLILLLVSILSYRRHPSPKLALVSASYVAYAVLGALVLIISLVRVPGLEISSVFVLLNIGVLLLQYLSLAKS